MSAIREPKARTIFCDFPWKYDNFGAKKHGAARGHYAGMTVEQGAAIPVARWAADDSVLLMWATWPKLAEALALIDAWGFVYTTGIPWIKTTPSSGEIRTGIGFWTQATSEMLLLARRGSVARSSRAPRVKGLLVGGLGERDEGEVGPLFQSFVPSFDRRTFYAPRGIHSVKPLEVQAWLERTLPGPRLELFGRVARAGWIVWGLELGFKLGPWGVRTCKPVRSLPLTAKQRATLAEGAARVEKAKGLGRALAKQVVQAEKRRRDPRATAAGVAR